MLAGGNHLDGSIVHGEGLVGTDALAACACALAIEGAAVHHEDTVCLYTCTSAHILFVRIVFARAGSDGCDSSTVNLYQSVAAQSLAGSSGCFYVDDSTFYIDGIISLDGVASGGFYVDVVARTEQYVIVAPDARLAVGIDVERALAREEHLAFAEEAGFHVFIIRGIAVFGAVGKSVLRAVCQDDVASLLALDVDGGSIGVGDVYAIQVEFKLIVAINLEETIGSGSAHVVANLLCRRFHDDIGPVDGYRYAIHTSRSGSRRTIEGNIHFVFEAVVFDEVFCLIAFRGYGFGFAECRLVDGNIEADQVAERTVVSNR